MDGILYIDKPKGMTSHDVVAKLRKILNTKKIGHAGTLDPDATGLLTILIGKATKLSESLMNTDKAYRVSFRLGLETETYDISGRVVAEKNPAGVTCESLTAALTEFQGEIEQKPPMFSAVKIGGHKLYELARKGIQIDVPARKVCIYRIELLSFASPNGEIDVECTKGTYVRSLVHDLGQRLGVGATAVDIRRLRSGNATLDHAIPFDQVLAGASVQDRIISVV